MSGVETLPETGHGHILKVSLDWKEIPAKIVADDTVPIFPVKAGNMSNRVKMQSRQVTRQVKIGHLLINEGRFHLDPQLCTRLK